MYTNLDKENVGKEGIPEGRPGGEYPSLTA